MCMREYSLCWVDWRVTGIGVRCMGVTSSTWSSVEPLLDKHWECRSHKLGERVGQAKNKGLPFDDFHGFFTSMLDILTDMDGRSACTCGMWTGYLRRCR